jgi:FMN-dependent NADH-azoreductase
MAILLYIKANPKPESESRTYQISESFINTYREKCPGDKIITYDLYAEGVKPITEEELRSRFSPKDDSALRHSIYKYAFEFKSCDKIVIAAPMWNLSFPAILKCYLDYIMAVGITFDYTEHGPVGLCQGKKAVHIVTRGGLYSEDPASAYEMGDKYLRGLFSFLGIVDFTTIAAEKLDIVGVDVEREMAKAIKVAQDKARNF